MDYLTNFYKSKAESLQEKINFLEKQLSDLNEQAPPARSFRAGDTSQAAWSEQELRERSRNIKKGGLFQKVSDEEQSQEWKDIQAELARREKKKTEKPEPKVETKVEPKPQAKIAPKPVETKEKPAPTRKPTEVPSAVATKKEVEQAQKVADTTQKPTALPTDVGPGRMHMTDMEGRPVSVEPKGAEVAQGTYSAKPDWAKEKAKPSTGIELDPKAAVLGIGGGLVAGKAITDIVNRQRGQGMAPKTPEAKVAPKAVEAPAKVTVPAEVPEKPVPQGAYSTKDGKVIVKGKPTVAERAALGRDLLRARMAQKTGAAPEAEVKPGDMSTKSGKVVNKGSEVTSKLKKFGKGLAHGAGTVGAAIAGEMAVEKGLEALGVENEHIKGVVAPTVGWAAGEGAIATGMGLARGLGMGAALAAGSAAAIPAAVYGAMAYPSYKAAEASMAAMKKEAESIHRGGSATKPRFVGPKY